MNPYDFLASEGIDASWMTPEMAEAEANAIKAHKEKTVNPNLLPPREALARLKEGAIQLGAATKDTFDQFNAGLVETATAVPWDIMAAGTGVVEGPLRAIGVLDPDINPEDSLTIRLQKKAQKGRDLADRAFGPPMTVGEEFVRGDIAAPLRELQELATPATKSAYDSLRELTKPLRSQDVVTHNNMPDFESEDEDQALEDLRQFVVEEVPAPDGKSVVLETPLGPMKMGAQEWAALGVGGLLTLGAMWAPSVVTKMKIMQPTKPRQLYDVPDAAPGTLGGSTRVDLARTYDDANAGILRYAEAIGMPKQIVDELSKSFEVHSRASARQLADAAIYTGDMTVAGMRFKAPPLSKLKMLDTPEARQYLHLRYLLDEIKIGRNMRLNPNNSSVQAAVAHMQSKPRPQVQGMTEADLLSQINVLERANPDLRKLATEYRQNVRELRRFMSTGEYATMTRRDQQAMNIMYPNEIPYKDRALDQAVDQGDPFMSLMVDVRKRIRDRLENEARGQYIDAMRRLNPRLMRKITKRQYEENPHWRANTITLQRRGRTEYYTTDPLVADVLKFDPYMYKDDWALSGARNLFEMTTTGSLAPWFAITSAIRSFRQGKINSPDGYTSPSILSTISAIPEQLIPQLAKVMTDSIERGTAWKGIEGLFGPNLAPALGRIAANVYDKSLFAAAQKRGGVNSSIFFREVDNATSNLAKIAKRGVTPHHRALGSLSNLLTGLWGTYRAGLNAVHSAPMYSFLKRNWDTVQDKDELIRQARQLAGDPHKIGQMWTSTGSPIRALTGELSDGLYDTTADAIAKGYGRATEFGRRAVPWYNYTIQGMKQAGKAYLANPSKFVLRGWLYGGLPTAAIYLYNHMLSQSEEAKANGWDYNERARGQYGFLMNDSIGKPGEPPENNMQIPRYHEFSVVSAMTAAWLDHIFREQDFTLGEDMSAVFDQWLNTVLMPPMPPAISLGVAATGRNPPMGMFGGDMFEVDKEPFVDNTPAWMDTIPRALGGAAAQIFAEMAMAYANTEEGIVEGVKNAFKQGSQSAAMRTPVLRDLLGLDMRRSSDTQIGDLAYESDRFIKEIAEYYKKWSVKEGQINVDPQSPTGNAAAGKWLEKFGEDPDTGMVPPDFTGTLPRIPDNPLYGYLMDSFYKSFAKDTGGDIEGFLSLWERAGNLNGKLKPLYRQDTGTMSSWLKEMEGRPDEIRYLRDHGVDYKNPTAVRNFYVEERQRLQRVIVKVIREGEKMMTDRVQAFKKAGFEQVMDPMVAGMTPEDVQLWLMLQQMRQQDPNYTLPDTVTLKDLEPYIAGGYRRHSYD